jgi:hypothetical protein
MTTVVVLNISGNVQLVECDGIARDGLIRSNIVLTGCKEFDTEDKDGKPLDTKVWSVHESLVVSYAVGNKAPKEEPVEEAPVEVAPAEPVRIPSLDEVEIDPARREQIRQQRAKVDQAARERRNAERAKRDALRIAAEEAKPQDDKPLAPVKRGGRKPKAPSEQA